MIYLESLDSIIESIYLGNELTESIKEAKIFINPSKVTYLAGKVIVITRLDYPDENIDILKTNSCNIISRVELDRDDVTLSPYYIRPCFDIMWNGDEIRLECEADIVEYITFDQFRRKLLMPKFSFHTLEVLDRRSNLTGLGWALHQVGVNQAIDTPFNDLDLYKTKKMDVRRA